MRVGSNLVLKSYIKTTVACLLVISVALLCALFALHWLPNVLGPVMSTLGALVALATAIFALAGVVVIARYQRGTLGKRDLFLELNRSREPDAIRTAVATRVSRARRYLSAVLLGHDLVVGDPVEIKTWEEISATLDERGCLEELPFMPEMLAMCGQRAYVFRCMHRLFDYRKTRLMRHMDGSVLLVGAICDGSHHGSCEASCHTIWKSAWLRRVEPNDDRSSTGTASHGKELVEDVSLLQFGTQAPRYSCQLTQLKAASLPINTWSAVDFLRPLIAGNVSPVAFAVGWLTNLFNELQQKRGGVGFPAFETVVPNVEKPQVTPLEVDDQVVVKSSSEIRATLNDQMLNRGLYFDSDMLKYCGQRGCVQAEVRRLVDIVTGEIITMKTPAYLLRGVHFSGERQLFNAQYEPLYWRSVWLKKVGPEA